MSKDAVMIAIDVGNSMDQAFSQEATRFKIALQCSKLTLQQKIFNNSSHQIGMCLFGDDESDDGNNLILRPLSKPDLDLVRKVQQLSNAKLGNQKAGGDIFDAINFVTESIQDYCGKKKFNKRAFIFTNGMGKTKYGMSNLNTLVKNLQQNAIKLNIITLDFMEGYDVENNVIDGETYHQPTQKANADMLMKMRQLQMDNIQIFPASIAIQIYKKFRKRDVAPIALFRGALQICPGLDIQVATYKAIRRQKLKSLAKYDLSKQFDPNISKEKDIITQTNYTIEGDKSGQLVDPQNITNAYNYGPNLVPISQLMENGTKIFEDKNFKLLGFVDKNKIPRQCFMGEMDMVIPSDDPYSRKLFTSFNYSMLSLNRYGIARYVPRTNKRGVNPRLVVLIPFRSADRQCFYLTELPTAEDVRDYSFNSLKKATEKQREIVRDLIDKMTLVQIDQNGDQLEELKVQNTFNPLRQYFFQSIFHRALSTDNQLPPLDNTIRSYITPQQRIFPRAKDQLTLIKNQFKLITKQLNRDKKQNSKAVMWKDILMADEKTGDEISMISTDDSVERVILNKKFNFDDEEDQALDKKMPIASFRRMLTNNKKDLVDIAIKQMIQYIEQKSKVIINEESLINIVDCARQLRKGCIEQKESEQWDKWLDTAKDNLSSQVFQKIKQQGLGYILKSNEIVYEFKQLHIQKFQDIIDDLD